MADHLPYLDDTFDIARQSGHVVGDDFEAELIEPTKATRTAAGSWIARGESRKFILRAGAVAPGVEMTNHVSALGGDVYRYRR